MRLPPVTHMMESSAYSRSLVSVRQEKYTFKFGKARSHYLSPCFSLPTITWKFILYIHVPQRLNSNAFTTCDTYGGVVSVKLQFGQR